MKLPEKHQKTLWMVIPALIAAAVFYYNTDQNGGFERPRFGHGSLVITRADQTAIPLNVEIATSPGEQAYGLMFRKKLAHDEGMIFVNQDDQVAHFWMENTVIPLDMLFVRQDGVIAKIVTNAKPLDTSVISSDEPIRDVIEINGGDTTRLEIAVGDTVAFPGLGAHK